MSSHSALAHLSIVSFILGAWCYPFADSPNGKRPTTMKLRRRDKVFREDKSDQRFDPEFAKRDLRAVLGKYSMASQFLDGIGLNPETHSDRGYTSFNDTPIHNFFKNSTLNQATHLLSRSEVDDSVIGLPGVQYAHSPHIMDLTDDMVENYDRLYYGSLNFGTPAQSLTVDIDTGSADLWVPTNCRSCADAQFRSKSSSTFRNTKHRFTACYGSGEVAGSVAQDDVTMGSLSVKEQYFGAVTFESEPLMDEPMSGIIGLAFGSIAFSKKPTFFENLLTSHQVSSAIFSVHLARQQERGSEVCFGCYDITKTTGPVKWLPLLSKTYWAVTMEGLSSNPSNHLETDLVAIMDTGTSLIHISDTAAKNFYSMIPGAKDASVEYGDGFYSYPCSSPVTLSLKLAGISFPMRTEDFNLGRLSEYPEMCVGGIVGIGEGFPSNLAIIGDEFLKSWYTSYDYGGARVGLAPSINNK